jgi:hypothetical protein
MLLTYRTNPAYIVALFGMELAETLDLPLADDFYEKVAEAADYCNELVPDKQD